MSPPSAFGASWAKGVLAIGTRQMNTSVCLDHQNQYLLPEKGIPSLNGSDMVERREILGEPSGSEISQSERG